MFKHTLRSFIYIICVYLFISLIPFSGFEDTTPDIQPYIDAETEPVDMRELESLYFSPGIAGASASPLTDKYIALTFDDGPHEAYTPEILDILREYGVKATFFIVGKNCEEHPELAARIIDEGHEVGNHTYSHLPNIAKADEDTIMRELLRVEDTLHELRGYRPRLFRPPGGVYNVTLDRVATQLNYTAVLWNVDTHDWRCPPSPKIATEVIKKVKPGYIVLMHDYVMGKSNTPAALRIFLPRLIELGYRFVTVSELINMSGTPEE